MMDRIYTNWDNDVDLFKKFASRNGWWSKKSQNSSQSFTIEKDSETKKPTIIVDLQNWDDYFPYLDSLSYFNSETGELSNDLEAIRGNSDEIYSLQSTCGGWDVIETDSEDDQ